ncbi:MAG: hypothetical protein PHV16_00220 [Candidatus Nanoarchaeia archaeon]|nr:hypothetical protein [Candidatus Nanoarchaeia archaeon]
MKKKNSGWIFLFLVLIVYIAIGVLDRDSFILSINFFLSMIGNILPVLFLVFALMVITTYFMNKDYFTKNLEKYTGVKTWILSIGAGLISTGPIFMWYPLLKDFQNRGIKKRFIAAFLYSTAIKPALVPLLIVYFGIQYTIILIIVMVFTSIAQGLIVEKLSEV